MRTTALANFTPQGKCSQLLHRPPTCVLIFIYSFCAHSWCARYEHNVKQIFLSQCIAGLQSPSRNKNSHPIAAHIHNNGGWRQPKRQSVVAEDGWFCEVPAAHCFPNNNAGSCIGLFTFRMPAAPIIGIISANRRANLYEMLADGPEEEVDINAFRSTITPCSKLP